MDTNTELMVFFNLKTTRKATGFSVVLLQYSSCNLIPGVNIVVVEFRNNYVIVSLS